MSENQSPHFDIALFMLFSIVMEHTSGSLHCQDLFWEGGGGGGGGGLVSFQLSDLCTDSLVLAKFHLLYILA